MLFACVREEGPQYFQEAGRAGRDGAPARCGLFVDLYTLPSLLPSRGRDALQTDAAQAALREMYHYAVRCNTCRVVQVPDWAALRGDS